MEILKKIGLTDLEIKIYVHLIDYGKCLAGDISKILHMNRSMTYQVLESLVSKGIVNYIMINKLRYFRPSDPRKLLEMLEKKQFELKEQEEEIRKFLPDLKTKYKERQINPEFEIYEGMEGFRTVLDDMIDSLEPGDEFCTLGWKGKLARESGHWYQHWTNRRIKKKLKRRLITNEKYLGSAKKQPLTEIRYLPKEDEVPLTFMVYSNKVLIRFWTGDKPYVLLMTSKDAEISFKKYFEIIWKVAKPFEY